MRSPFNLAALTPEAKNVGGDNGFILGGGQAAGYGTITTEIVDAGPFYYAEEYHQQYLHKVPNGYCGLGGTGVTCSAGIGVKA